MLRSGHAATSPVILEAETGRPVAGAVNVADPTASGGAAVTFRQSAGSSVGTLPFDMPSQTVLKASSKKVYAHYFTPYPISEDNVDPGVDYYSRNHNNPTGEVNKYFAEGGMFRQRPIPRTPLVAPKYPVPNSWQMADMKTEVNRAANAGLDGFTVDILGTGGQNWDRLHQLLDAVPQVDPKFKIMLMPDTNSITANNYTAIGYAASIANIAQAYPTTVAKLDDGRLIITPFAPENKGAAFWQTFLDTMQNTYHIPVAFVPCFIYFDSSQAANPKFSSFFNMSYGLSSWGGRSQASNSTVTAVNNVLFSHNTLSNKIWMAPVAVQDVRPNQHTYDEADNSELLRKTWNNAIASGADWIQIPTWNDYSEGAEISPSTHTGWGPLDISSYYLSRYKSSTASWPMIVRDVIYLSHRVQSAGATVTNETKPMVLRSGSSPARDKIEVLAFLISKADISLTVAGGTIKSAVVQAADGSSAVVFNLTASGAGTVSASVSRSGGAATTTVTSPFAITTGNVNIQDEQYYFITSGR